MAITPGGTLTEAEATQVLFMKQEEKLARDVYLTLGAAWSHPTFQNISGAEQRHMDALDRVIAAYQLPDAAPAEVGRFTIPELQKLYDQLVAQGKPSLEAALKVGVLVEETDIADLQKLLDSTSNPTLRRVAGNLQQASRSHLAAFNRSLETPTAMVSGNSPQNGRGYGRRGHRGGRGGW
jgi:hypothetical protein